MNNFVRFEVPLEYSPNVYPYQRNSNWYWKFKLPTGSWFYGRAPGDSKTAVSRNARLKEKELCKGFFVEKELEKIKESSGNVLTFSEAIRQFVEHLESEGRTQCYTHCLKVQLNGSRRFFEDHLKVQFVHKVTEEHAHRFRTFLLKKVNLGEIKKVTAHGQLGDMKRLFKWLKKRKKIANPWVDVDSISVPKIEKSRSVAPSRDVIQKIMAVDHKHRWEFPTQTFLYGLYRTGARKRELLNMELGDVDWRTGLWTIQPKTCPTLAGHHWAPKNGQARITVLPKDFLEKLQPLVARVRNHKVVGYAPDEEGNKVPTEADFLFTMRDRHLSKDAGVPIYRSVDRVNGAWRALMKDAGMGLGREDENWFTRHDMRRGFNLEAKRAGMSLDDRALILGHGRGVNEEHYCGKPELNTEKLAEILNEKMKLIAG